MMFVLLEYESCPVKLGPNVLALFGAYADHLISILCHSFVCNLIQFQNSIECNILSAKARTINYPKCRFIACDKNMPPHYVSCDATVSCDNNKLC